MIQFMQTLKVQLTADKKKTVLLAGLACVLLGVVGRAVFCGSSSELATPATAKASVPATPRLTALVTPTPEVHAVELVAGTRARAAAAFSPEITPRRTVATGHMDRELARDIFSAQNWACFPLLDQVKEASAVSQGGFRLWGNLLDAAVEYQKQRRVQADTLTRELSDLHLQSTLTGALPLAYISGRLVHEGEHVSGFSVVRIEERRVVLNKFGQIHELRMP